MSRKIMLVMFLAFNAALSCSDTDDNQVGNLALEDLSGLESDMDYIEYCNTLHEVAQQVWSTHRAKVIVDSGDISSEEQKKKLAKALGFSSVDELEEFFEVQSKRIMNIAKRYNFDGNNVQLATVFNRLMLNNHPRGTDNLGSRRSQNEEDELDEICLDALDTCDDSLILAEPGLNNPEFLKEHFCSHLTDNTPQMANCLKLVHARLAAEWASVTFDWCQCLLIDWNCDWPDNINKACGF